MRRNARLAWVGCLVGLAAGLTWLTGSAGAAPVSVPYVAATTATATPLKLTISSDDYWGLVAESRQIAARLVDLPTLKAAPVLQALARRWEAVTAVLLPAGQTVPIDSAYLVHLLRAEPPDLPRLVDLLTSLADSDTSWSQPAPAPMGEAKALAYLASILSRPEYQWPSTEPTWVERAWRWLLEQLRILLSRFLPKQLTFNGNPLNFWLGVTALLILALVLGFILRSLSAGLVAEATLAFESQAGDELLTADSALQKAQGQSAAGDYRSAVRYLYLSALLLLEERGLLRYDRTRTNREYLRSLSSRPDLAVRLQAVVEVFDRVWYGFQSLDASAYDRYQAQVTDLRQQK